MASNPGEWYEARRLEAVRLTHELAGARKVLEALDGVEGGKTSGGRMHEVAREVVRHLERKLERARYVGD